ncbi:hypothetical protein Cni_G11760 [Canna indica]|uniref:Uncharacterized protein n=1 Tax=Canna indica TaxID=4628 RepID=A0AAQ3K6Y9_9LILI|nr:hypothetical protein Cni_G11760 [Canna indica]
MEAVRQQKLQASMRVVLSQLLLLLFTFFIIIFCCYYSCIHLMLDQSISITSIFHHVDLDRFINRRAMFLFCNAILLFIARDSGLLLFFAPAADVEFSHQKATRERESRSRRRDRRGSKRHVVELCDLAALKNDGSSGEERTHDRISKPCEVVEKTTIPVERAVSLDLVAVERVDDGQNYALEHELDELHKKIEEFIHKMKIQRKMEAFEEINQTANASYVHADMPLMCR